MGAAGDLRRYYDAEVGRRRGRGLDPQRVDRRTAFVEALRGAGARRVLEVGCGPGRDGAAFAAAGLAWTGLDLSPVTVAACREAGLRAVVGSATALPFATGAVDAAWTMSALMHLDEAELAAALAELARVIRPGGRLAVGVWSAEATREEWLDVGDGLGPRYFRLRSEADLRSALDGVGPVEEWASWTGEAGPWTYRWAVLRRRAASSGPPL